MKLTKKMISALFAGILLVSGCGKGKKADENNAKPEETVDPAAASSAASVTPADISPASLFTGLDKDGKIAVDFDMSKVTLPDYSHIVLSEAPVEVSDEEVEAEIAAIMEEHQEVVQIMDRETALGDTVNIDFVGTIDDVPFDGGNTNGFGMDLVLGSHSFIDTFEDQLCNHMPGDVVKVEVRFPDNYGVADLAGKDAVFMTTINYIKEDAAPELTDEFVANNLKDLYGCTTVETLRHTIRVDMETERKYTALWQWLSDNTEFAEEPTALRDAMTDNYIEVLKTYADGSGVNFESYLTYLGMSSEDDLREVYNQETSETARRYVIAQMISEKENLQIDENAIREYFHGEDYSGFIAYYGEGYVKMQVRLRKVYDALIDNVTFA